ncbi:MAG: amidohydrolase family protein [Sphaerochaetaceae bacterium]|jgi:N-acetylglucosamine-6-phosphate deacetylase|nr:amidohydrolase family protein [Sphaerochaetaceae bacterium]MDD2407131.1 amidohydrolase family protein [Sphaerochaetaceae bacterium]MDD4259697.1 amidohydrolase family protein [Sphaerochaetaceae bacterium]MDD4842419.1 amidohydrolase family protein [Sphaerochaetaceae bacterium]NLO61530.1 amidohydrolase family protein [Spirochaetales bacterium]
MLTVRGISPFDNSIIELDINSSCIAKKTVCSANDQIRAYVSPGFIDIQVNGYMGMDYSSATLQPEHLESMVRSMAATGTTQHCPTIVTASQDRILRNLELIRTTRDASPLLQHAIPGIHVEGPYISGADGARGTHDAAFVRNPDLNEFKEWQDAAKGLVKIVTLAPETKGALRFIEEVAATGVVVAIGHTQAKPAEILKAVEAGARLSTHLGNGSPTMINRLRNHIWPQLACDKLVASIITDGDHLPAEVVKTYTRAKGLDRLVLISDVAPLGGFKKGLYKWGNVDVEVFDDGHIGLPGTEILAGAAHMLDWDILHFMKYSHVTLAQSIRLCTINAAKLLNLSSVSLDFAQGSVATLVSFTYDTHDTALQIEKTLIAGQVVFEHQ